MMDYLDVYRYPSVHKVTTHLDQFSDILEWLKYLTSPEYLKGILVGRHSLNPAQADRRLRQIIPHVATAISFIEQARSGPEDVSFLPTYYAVLDLSKVYVLLGPRHADLPRHRWHGASYNVHAKESHSVRTETVTLKREGALALLYETLTGLPAKKERQISMGRVYSHIKEISAEYALATGDQPEIASLLFSVKGQRSPFTVQVEVVPRSSDTTLTVRSVPCLKGFRKVPGRANTFTSPPLACPIAQVRQQLRSYLSEHLLYSSDTGVPEVALCSRSFPMPEEFPIALLFFHMSSVVRYKPEFLKKIQDSRWWPVLIAARRHCLFRFMLLSWSFVHREQLVFAPVEPS
jgi:hypothetical protein